MDSSGDERIEAVIAEGTKLLGTPYVYGAVRYHDGNGNKLKNFKISEFDCSSLMQYMFYHGADKLLTLTTRTQVKQGVTVSKSQLKRGDLMFFTNSTSTPAKLIVEGIIDKFFNFVFIIPSVILQFPVIIS